MSRQKKLLPVIGQDEPASEQGPRAEALVGQEKTILRIEGMDCASCALTVERGVSRLAGVRRATVNFAAGRLDAEHDAGLAVQEIEAAVRGAGYGVVKVGEAKRVPFWRTPPGTDVALETADVALMKDDLPKLAEAVALSRAAERVIRQNVVVSILIKGVFVMLAPFGLVALWLAVLADMGTSIAVTLNGLRLFRRGR